MVSGIMLQYGGWYYCVWYIALVWWIVFWCLAVSHPAKHEGLNTGTRDMFTACIQKVDFFLSFCLRFNIIYFLVKIMCINEIRNKEHGIHILLARKYITLGILTCDLIDSQFFFFRFPIFSFPGQRNLLASKYFGDAAIGRHCTLHPGCPLRAGCGLTLFYPQNSHKKK